MSFLLLKSLESKESDIHREVGATPWEPGQRVAWTKCAAESGVKGGWPSSWDKRSLGRERKGVDDCHPPLWAIAPWPRREEAVPEHVFGGKQLCAIIVVLINTMTYLRKGKWNGCSDQKNKRNKRSGRIIFTQFRERAVVRYLLICSFLTQEGEDALSTL